MQSKMMAYDRAVGELNAARLRGTSCPIIHLFMQAAASLNAEVSPEQILYTNPSLTDVLSVARVSSDNVQLSCSCEDHW